MSYGLFLEILKVEQAREYLVVVYLAYAVCNGLGSFRSSRFLQPYKKQLEPGLSVEW